MHKSRLTVVAFLAISVIVSMFLLCIQFRNFFTLNNEIHLLEIRHETRKDIFLMHDAYIAEMEILKVQLESKEGLLPSWEKFVESIVYLNELLAEYKITEQEFIVGNSVYENDTEGLMKSTVRLRGTGSYGNVSKFLLMLEAAGDFYFIEEAVISSLNSDSDSVSMSLSIIVFADKGRTMSILSEGSDYYR